VNEPEAISLSFGREGRFLVLNFGAETADLSVIENGGRILESVSLRVGGGDFDHALAEWLYGRLRSGRAQPPEKDDPLWRVLLPEAEAIKIALSSRQTCDWTPPPDLPGAWPVRAEREDFERVARFSIRRVVNAAEGLWERHAPDRLLLAGGSARIPLLRETLGKEGRLTFCAEGAAALGAALCARTGEEPAAAPSSPRQRIRGLKLRLAPLETLLSEDHARRLRLLVDQAEKLGNEPSIELLERIVKEVEAALS
jgi:molecular chaperone DnaK